MRGAGDTRDTAPLLALIQALVIKSIFRWAMQNYFADRKTYEDTTEGQAAFVAVFRGHNLQLPSWNHWFVHVCSVLKISKSVNLETKSSKKGLEIAGATRTVSAESALANVKTHDKMGSKEPDVRLCVFILSVLYLELCDERDWNSLDLCQELVDCSRQARHFSVRTTWAFAKNERCLAAWVGRTWTTITLCSCSSEPEEQKNLRKTLCYMISHEIIKRSKRN